MELPTELYVILFGMANDLTTTKSLRSVSKSALLASHYYHKILLATPLCVGFTGFGWIVLLTKGKDDSSLQQNVLERYDDPNNYGRLLGMGDLWNWEEFTALKMTVQELLSIPSKFDRRTCITCYPKDESDGGGTTS